MKKTTTTIKLYGTFLQEGNKTTGKAILNMYFYKGQKEYHFSLNASQSHNFRIVAARNIEYSNEE